MKNTPGIELLIVDDDKLIAQLLRDFLSSQEQLIVKGILHSGNQLLDHLKQAEGLPDIIILDLKMENGSGMEAMEVIQQEYPNIKVIALSSLFQPSYTGYMMRAGFHAFLPKETNKNQLLEVIHIVHQKGCYLSPDQIEALRQQISNKAPKVATHSKQSLTNRELEVLKLLCEQLSAKEIAQKLYISTKTAEAHKSNLLLKTGTKNTAGLIVYAIQNGIINPDEVMLMS